MQLDPPNYTPKLSGQIAKIAQENGLDAIAVGGSIGAQGELLHETIKEIKAQSTLPVILFPGNIATLSKHADAAYFLSLLNSNDPYWITGAQISAAFPFTVQSKYALSLIGFNIPTTSSKSTDLCFKDIPDSPGNIPILLFDAD